MSARDWACETWETHHIRAGGRRNFYEWHGCILEPDHDGQHVCDCGATAERSEVE